MKILENLEMERLISGLIFINQDYHILDKIHKQLTMWTTKRKWDLGKRHRFISQEEIDIDIPDGDAVRGEKLFNELCSGCHALEGFESTGPPLRDVYNRKAINKTWPYRQRIPYKLFDTYWTKERLFIFLENPEDISPDMTYEGVKDSFDRACIIEYLHYLKIQT